MSIDISCFENRKTGLVLSGGVVKAAAWHLGVCRALDELGFSFKHNHSTSSPHEISTYVGSSAGALIATYLANGFKPEEVINAYISKNKSKDLKGLTYRDILKLCKAKTQDYSHIYKPFEGIPTFLSSVLRPIIHRPGIFTTEGIRDYLLENVLQSDNFSDYDADLFIVATQLDHSRKYIFGKYTYPNCSHDSTAFYSQDAKISDASAASMSVTPLYSPYKITHSDDQSRYYIDGEVRETLSTHVALDNSCDVVISSWTHTPYHYNREIGSLFNYGMPAIALQTINLMIQKKIINKRAEKNNAEDILDTVSDFLKDHRFENKYRKKLLDILERKLDYRKGVTMIDIYPNHDNYKVFFSNLFSLKPENTLELVTFGYNRTMEVFKQHDWF